MTDNEIIKILIDYGTQCKPYVISAAIDLINRQQAEINKLNAENMLTISERNAFRTSFYDVLKQLKIAKSEAIKEFAERLKKAFIKCDPMFNRHIDKLVKEMVGED